MSKSTEDINEFTEDIDQWDYEKICRMIHLLDIEAYEAVGREIEKISNVSEMIVHSIMNGGRVIYVGAGTSGRIAAQDVIELLPTYGLSNEFFDYVIAGGTKAMAVSVEGAEDDRDEAIKSLKEKNVTSFDVIVGVSASGQTPFVISALEYAKSLGCKTVAITCNENTPLSKVSDISIELLTGPEVIQGSTRMKAGTAQKMTLNIISTTIAIKLGKTFRNTMSNMGSWYNEKLKKRALNILVKQFNLSPDNAEKLLEESNYKVSEAIEKIKRLKIK